MKLETAKRDILLAETGELSPWRRRRLERYLAQSLEARAYRDELREVSLMAREESVEGPSDFTVNRILDEGRRLQPSRAPARAREADIVFPWRPALAVASVVVLLLAGSLVWRGTPEPASQAQVPEPATPQEVAWDDSLDEEIAELSEMLASAVDEDELARQLLELEGSQI
jgi:hypothetical protein